MGCATGCFQAAVEAETDIDALLLARKQLGDIGQLYLPYAAVALLGLVDVLKELSARTRRLVNLVDARGATAPEGSAELIAAKKSFDEMCDDGPERPLRDFVRQKVSAHRVQQTVESHSLTHGAINRGPLADMITVARRLVWTMQSMPVWFWASSLPDGRVTLLRCRNRSLSSLDEMPLGLEPPPRFFNNARPTSMGHGDVVEEDELRYAEALKKANDFWQLKEAEMKCCGLPSKSRN